MSLIKRILKTFFGSKQEKQIELKKPEKHVRQVHQELKTRKFEKFESVKKLSDLSTKTSSLEKDEKIKKYFYQLKNKFNFFNRTYKSKRSNIENEVFDLEFYHNNTDLVRAHLISEGEITQCTAVMVYGIKRLSAIIYELKKRGMEIESFRDKQNLKTCDYMTYILKNNPHGNN